MTKTIIYKVKEKNQPLLIEITRKKINSFQIQEINTTLGCIMGSKKNSLQKKHRRFGGVFYSLVIMIICELPNRCATLVQTKLFLVA